MSLSPQQHKAIRKVTETMQEYPLGIEFSELMQKAVMSKSGLSKTLAIVGASQSTDGLWHLPHSKGTPAKDGDKHENDGGNSENTPAKGIDVALEKMGFIPSGGNTQDDGGNTQATPISYPNNNEATPTSEPQKRFVLIENCYLSLAKDGTGQEPSLAKDTWFDDEGDEVEEEDCKVLNRAREPHVNEIEFKGVTYRNLFVAESQLFHGIFDDIQTAKDRMDELMAKKPSNNFELLEV